MWHLLPDTQEFLRKVKARQTELKDELGEGHLIIEDNDKLSRQYCYQVGIIEGLKFLEEYITVEKEHVESSTVSREDASRGY